MDKEDERKELFNTLKAEIFKRQLSNAESFDKAILAYSSAGLGFSLAFLKDFLPINKAAYGWLLYGSWALFSLAIILTILSYIISQQGQKRQLNRAERYYIGHDETAWEEKNVFDPLTDFINNLSGLFFILAIVFTTFFVSINLERATMKNSIFDGAPIPSMQKIPQTGDVERGAQVPPLQQVPQQQPKPQQPAPQNNPKGDTKK